MEFTVVHRRENIVLTAIELIHEYGIHSVSTKEISKRLKISESTIFKHFLRKNDLLLAALDHFSLYDNDIFHTAKTQKKGPKNAILFYINTYAAYYENYPAITALIQAYDTVRGIPELEKKAVSIYMNRLVYMKELIQKAQEDGIVCKNADADSLAVILTSTCTGICLNWRISNFSFKLREKLMDTVNMLLDAFSD